MTRTRLVLLRHGRTPWNAASRAQGQLDVELDEIGHAQAAAAARCLARVNPAALWSSDLSRARTTCSYLEKETGLVAVEDPRLREFHLGERQGLTLAEFGERFPVEYERWHAGDQMLPVLGGEGFDDVRRRMHAALSEHLDALDPGQTGVVVSHGAALKVALIGLLGWPRDLYSSLRAMDNCAWATVERLPDRTRLRLAGYNQRADFASGQPVR